MWHAIYETITTMRVPRSMANDWPLYVMRGLVRQITRWHSRSSGSTNFEHIGHLKPEIKEWTYSAGMCTMILSTQKNEYHYTCGQEEHNRDKWQDAKTLKAVPLVFSPSHWCWWRGTQCGGILWHWPPWLSSWSGSLSEIDPWAHTLPH